jgi:hypothetical protein
MSTIESIMKYLNINHARLAKVFQSKLNNNSS